MHTIFFEAIGTKWSIETNKTLTKQLQEAIFTTIEAFDKTYSRFRSDSLVSEISRNAGIYTFPADMDRLFSFYEQLYDITHGKVTPLIGAVLEKAGYDPTYSFIPSKQEDTPLWQQVMHRNGTVLEVTQPITLDVGAAGKGPGGPACGLPGSHA